MIIENILINYLVNINPKILKSIEVRRLKINPVLS